MAGQGPDFLVIGAQKSGTTWLHQNLGFHPDIWLPPEKELHFFDERLDSDLSLASRAFGDSLEAVRWRRQVRRQWRRIRNDPSSRTNLRWYARFFLGRGDVDWYRGLFRPDDGQLAGEVTPDYGIVDDDRVDLVHELFPDLRLFLLCRNPIERVWSHAQMEERLGGRPAAEAAVAMLDETRPRRYTDYLGIIDRWVGPYLPDQLWVGSAEDIAAHPRAVINQVTDHLGLERHHRYPKATRVVHEGGHQAIPLHVAATLAEGLQDEIDQLARRLGGHAHWWAWTARALRKRALREPDTELRYPLWDSELADAFEREQEERPGATFASSVFSKLPA